MHIMAAVVSDESKFQTTLMHSPSRNAPTLNLPSVNLANESPWRKLKDQNPIMQEHVLCTLKSYPDGALEVTPGFSEEEPESDEEGPFRSLRAERVVSEKGPRLTSFSFKTIGNDGHVDQIYRYTLENMSAELDPTRVEELVAASGKSLNRQPSSAHLGFVWPDSSPEILHHHLRSRVANRVLRYRLELISAVGFSADEMYLEYQVLLPAGWRCPTSERAQWKVTEQGEHTFQGSTQIAMVEELPKGKWTSTNPGLFQQSSAVATPALVGLGAAGKCFLEP
jgi:hypothetical protein